MLERHSADLEREIREQLEPDPAVAARIARQALSAPESKTYWAHAALVTTAAGAVTVVAFVWPSAPSVQATQFSIHGSGDCVTTIGIGPTGKTTSVTCHSRKPNDDRLIWGASGTISITAIVPQHEIEENEPVC